MSLRTPARFAFALLALISSLVRLASAEPLRPESIPISDEYVVQKWELDDGMPSNVVNAVAQSPDGYLWVGTHGGLARFDGTRFVNFWKNSTPPLESTGIGAELVSREGDLWFSVAGGISRRINGRFEVVLSGTVDQPFRGSIRGLVQDAAGAIWGGCDFPATIGRLQGQQITIFRDVEGRPFGSMVVATSKEGTVWFGDQLGLGYFDGQRFRSVAQSDRGDKVLALARNGGIWARSGEKLFRYRNDGSRYFVADLGTLSVISMYEAADGDLWLGTNNSGLFRLRDGKFAQVSASDTPVSSVMEDRERNLWIGTIGSGLRRLQPRHFFLWQTKDGLPFPNVYSVCRDTEGRIWASGMNRMLVRGTDATNRAFAVPENWVGGAMAVCAEPTGGIWLATLKGLMRWKDGAFTEEGPREKLTGVFVDRQGDLWVATIDGQLVRHRDGKDYLVPKETGVWQPRAMAEDSEGRLWVGTENGQVLYRRNGAFVPVPLPVAESIGQVQFIVPDGKDTVWIGSLSDGLFRWRAGKVTRLPQDSGFPSPELHSMVIAPDGNVWVGTRQGLYRVRHEELHAVMDGKREVMDSVSYGQSDGIPKSDFALGFRNPALIGPDGHVWFATGRGILEILPGERNKPSPEWPVIIEELQAGPRSLSPVAGARIELPPHPGPVQIRYTLPRFGNPEQVRFRYRLAGSGAEEWIQAGDQRVATFSRLPAGNYRFDVAASVAGETWVPRTASVPFTIRAAWWETAWFRTAVLLSGALGIAWLVRLIVNRRMAARMRRLEQANALERERTRIARDMHDELGSRLTRIAFISDLAGGNTGVPAETAEQLDEISEASRGVVRTLDEIVWTLNPRNDTLDRLVDYLTEWARSFLSSTELELGLELPAAVPAQPVSSDTRHNVLMAVREAFTNIVKHANAKRVCLRVALGDEVCTIVIADNGSGFVPDSVSSSSNGLGNLEQRLLSIGGECRVESAAGKGTVITFIVPFSREN